MAAISAYCRRPLAPARIASAVGERYRSATAYGGTGLLRSARRLACGLPLPPT